MVYLRLIRYPNLLIIALVQYLLRHFLIAPLASLYNFELQVGDFHFFLLVLSTVLIAAGGYAINDYFDVRIDRLNKPDEMVIDKSVERREAMLLHAILTGAGLFLGIVVAYKAGMLYLAVIHVLCAILLWYYSLSWKRIFLIGNLVVALLTALVPITSGAFDLLPMVAAYDAEIRQLDLTLAPFIYWVAGYSSFAFLLTWLRETVKDMEDIEGDRACGSHSLAVVLGDAKSRWVTTLLALVALLMLGMLQYRFMHDWLSIFYFSLLLYLPLLLSIGKVFRAKGKGDYHIAGNMLKGVMLAGIFYLVVHRFVPWLWLKDVS